MSLLHERRQKNNSEGHKVNATMSNNSKCLYCMCGEDFYSLSQKIEHFLIHEYFFDFLRRVSLSYETGLLYGTILRPRLSSFSETFLL